MLFKSFIIVFCVGYISALAADKISISIGLHKYFAMHKATIVVGFITDVHNDLVKLNCQLQNQNCFI